MLEICGWVPPGGGVPSRWPCRSQARLASEALVGKATNLAQFSGSGSVDDIAALDAYFDAAPRADTDVVETGAFTLFVSRTPWSYYARPTLRCDAPITTASLDRLAQACAEHDVRLAVEWLAEVHPELSDVAVAYGLEVSTHALMVAGADDVSAPETDGVTLRVIAAEDPALLSGRAVADVSFIAGGTDTGPEGAKERDAFAGGLPDELVAHLRNRHRRGLTVTAVAESDEGVLAVGSYQPMGDHAEILAVATLPVARRRGLGGAIAQLLARHAMEHGVRTTLLSAQDDNVARVYERVGFRRVGSTHSAERPQ